MDKSWSIHGNFRLHHSFARKRRPKNPAYPSIFPGPRSFATRRISWSPSAASPRPRQRWWNGCGTLRRSSSSWKGRQQRIGVAWGWNWPMRRLGSLIFPDRLWAFGKRVHNYGKSECLMGKLTSSMAIFHIYAKLPDGYSQIIIWGSVDLNKGAAPVWPSSSLGALAGAKWNAKIDATDAR